MGFLRALLKEIGEDDVAGASAELAFRFLFALFPFVIFLSALGSMASRWLGIDDPTARLLDQFATTLPEEAATLVEGALEGVFATQNAGLLSIGAIAALWAASGGTKSLMKAMNRAYDVEESRPFLRKQLVGLGLTLLGALAFIAAAALLIVGQVVGTQVAGGLGVGDAWATVVAWARIPAVVVLMLAAMAFLYWAAPNVDIPFKWVTPGSLAFVAAWLVATLGFGFYVANFGNYNATYGTLGAVVILMMWLYITAFVILLGAEVNAVLHARTEPETLEREAPEGALPGKGSESPADAHAEGERDVQAPSGGRGAPLPRTARPAAVLGAAVAGIVAARVARSQVSWR